jgi:hypothetical protein
MALKFAAAWLGRHHPEARSRIITGQIRTTTRDTPTVLTADVARACVMALRIIAPPLKVQDRRTEVNQSN